MVLFVSLFLASHSIISPISNLQHDRHITYLKSVALRLLICCSCCESKEVVKFCKDMAI